MPGSRVRVGVERAATLEAELAATPTQPTDQGNSGPENIDIAIDMTLPESIMLRPLPAGVAERAQLFSDLLDISEAIHSIGVETALKLATFALATVQDPAIYVNELERLRRALEGIASLTIFEKWQLTPNDRLFGFTYMLLRLRLIDWTEAAAIATLRLRKPMSANTYRMRIGRWAASHGLAPVQFRLRRPRSRK